MGLQCCLGGTTFHTLKLAAIPSPSFYSSSIFRSFSKTLTLDLLPRHHSSQKRALPLLIRAFSVQAVQVSPSVAPDENVVKPQWKASIDFKWIRDNKDAVAANIKKRNSNANLGLVLELYEGLLNVQKEVERLRTERNVVANKMKGKLEPSERQKLIEEGKNLKEGLVTLEEDLLKLRDELQQEVQRIPNMTHPDVPVGGEDCSALRKWLAAPESLASLLKITSKLEKIWISLILMLPQRSVDLNSII